jgi:hypothetical protein
MRISGQRGNAGVSYSIKYAGTISRYSEMQRTGADGLMMQ